MPQPLSRHLPPGIKSALKRMRDAVKGVVGARRLRHRLSGVTAPKIVVGTSGIFEPGWIPTDIEYLNLLHPEDWRRFFAEASIGAILAEHVWEHMTLEEGLRAARQCHRFLHPGGYLRLAVPDGGNPDPSYIQQVEVDGSGSGANDHKVLYTCATLSRLLQQAGFTVTPLEHFDPQGNFQSRKWSPADGLVHRSRQFDERNQDGRLVYTSLMVDAFKR
jgi:predicted SAM-dependent methyltransferase